MASTSKPSTFIIVRILEPDLQHKLKLKLVCNVFIKNATKGWVPLDGALEGNKWSIVIWTKGVKFFSNSTTCSQLNTNTFEKNICLQFLISRNLICGGFSEQISETISIPRRTKFVQQDQWFYAISHFSFFLERTINPNKWRLTLLRVFKTPTILKNVFEQRFFLIFYWFLFFFIHTIFLENWSEIEEFFY